MAVTLVTTARATPESPNYFPLLLEFEETENGVVWLKTMLGGERVRKQKQLTVKLRAYYRPGTLIFIDNCVS